MRKLEVASTLEPLELNHHTIQVSWCIHASDDQFRTSVRKTVTRLRLICDRRSTYVDVSQV
ncbi:hypothetical protein KI387_020315, partial [Taxus chinensis]